MTSKRPKNLNLFTIRLPVNAMVSILHRVSGVVLFLMVPVMLTGMQFLLESEHTYGTLMVLLNHWSLKVLIIGISAAFFHHFFAGLRHLIMDLHWLKSLHQAKFSSRFVLRLDVLATILFAWFIW